MAEIGEKEVRERKQLARKKGRLKKGKARSIFKNLITNSDFNDFYHATRFLKTKETPKALLAVTINENIDMVLITSSNVLFLKSQSNEDVKIEGIHLKGVVPFESINKFVLPSSQKKGSFFIESKDNSYRSGQIPAEIVNGINNQLSNLVTSTSDQLVAETVKDTGSNEDGDNSSNEKPVEEKILEKLSHIEDKIGDSVNYKYKIVSGPVLSGSEKLQRKLNRLGNSGWELVDTQRHSIAAKQHAVCFLKKKV